MKKVKFGILGCGLIGDVHIRALLEVDGCELFAVCDASSERAEEFGKKHGVKAYSDYLKMLADPEIDAVAICTPSGMHKDQTIAALNANKHVLVEKPMALTSADAKEICDAAEKSDKIVSVIFQMRFTEDLQYLKKVIEEGRLGQLTFCDLYMKYWRDPSYYAASPWRGTFAMDGGGALMNQGIHGIDLLEYIVGGVKDVQGIVRTLSHRIEVEDTAVAMLEFESGALGTIVASTCAYPGFERRIEIHGDRGYAVLTENSIEKLMIDGIEQSTEKVSVANTASDPTAVQSMMHKIEIENLLSAIEGRGELLIDAKEGKRAVRIIEEIYKSSRQGG